MVKTSLRKVVLVPLDDVQSGRASTNLAEFSSYVQKVLPPIEAVRVEQTVPPPPSSALVRYRAAEASRVQQEAIPLSYEPLVPNYAGTNDPQPSTSQPYSPPEDFPPIPRGDELMSVEYPPMSHKRRWNEMQASDGLNDDDGGPPLKRVLSMRERKKSRFLNEPYINEKARVLKRKLIGRGMWLH